LTTFSRLPTIARSPVAGLQALNGRRGQIGAARQLLLIDAKQRAGGFHLGTGDHLAIYRDIWCVSKARRVQAAQRERHGHRPPVRAVSLP
jgi:hypothetical protein